MNKENKEFNMKNLKELELKYEELGKEIENLKGKPKYPIYCKSKVTDLVVKFKDRNMGEVVQRNSHSVGVVSNDWISHNNRKHWEQLEVCEETGFFDGQLVWCWDEKFKHVRILSFYDVKNKRAFSYNGERIGLKWENYEACEGNYPEWALEAFKTLEI